MCLLLLLWRHLLAQCHVASFSYGVQRFRGRNLRRGTTAVLRRSLVWHSMSVCDVNRTTTSSIWSCRALSSPFSRSFRSRFSRDVQIASDLVDFVIIDIIIIIIIIISSLACCPCVSTARCSCTTIRYKSKMINQPSDVSAYACLSF